MNIKHNRGNQTIGHAPFHEKGGNQNPICENAIAVLAYKKMGGICNGKKIINTTVH